MPIVPYQRKVSAAPVSGVKEQGFANAESFGANDARQIGQLGNIASKLGDTAIQYSNIEDEKLAKAAAREALANAQRESDAVLFGDGGKNKGLYNRQGLEVKTVINDYDKSIEDIKRRHTEKLDNYGRELFEASFNSYKEGNARSLSRFRGSEIEKYDIATKDAENKQLVDNSVINRSAIDEKGNNQFIDNAQKRIALNVASKYAGYGKEVRNQKIQEELSNLHASVLDAHILDDPKKAKDYIDKYGDKMVAITREKYNKVIEKGLENQLVRDKALELLNGKTEEEAYKEINNIKDVDIAAKVKRAVKDGFAEKKYFAEQKYKEKYEGLVDELMNDPFNFDVKKHYSFLDGNDQIKLERLQDSQKKAAMGGAETTDWATYDRLMSLPQKELQKEDLVGLKGKLTIADFKFFRKRAQEGDKNYKSVQSLNSFVSAFAKSVSKDNNDKQRAVRELFQTELDNYPEAQRNNIETWNRIQDTLSMEVLVKGDIFDSKYYEAKAAGKTIIAPDTKPDKVPKGSQWIDKKSTKTGRLYRGWVYTDPNGRKLLYVPDGKGGADGPFGEE